MDKIKSNNLFTPVFAAFYYGALIAMLLLFWSDGNIPSALRYPFAISPLLPAIFSDKKWLWPSLICFLTIFSNMPGEQFIFNHFLYVSIAFVVVVYYCIRDGHVMQPLEIAPFALATVYMIVIDLGAGDQLIHQLNLLVCLSALLAVSSPKEREDVVQYGTYAFIVASIVISIVYWLNFQNFAVEYGRTEIMRSYYMDPNYQGSILGMGICLAIYKILNQQTGKLWQKILCVLGVVVPLIAMFTLASRGALLAVIVTVLLLMTMSKTSISVKIVMVILGFALILYAYSSHYMDLLVVRMQEKSLITGTNRTVIWESKIDAFSRDNNILHWLFGVGRMNSFMIGEYKLGIYGSAFHNQFLAVLVNYGIVGLIGFIYLLLLPIRKARKTDRLMVAIFMFYLVTVCFTLEPLTTAFPTFWIYYFFVYLYATRGDCLPSVDDTSKYACHV